MTNGDLDEIEAALGVKLPDAYRRVMLTFPLRYYAGTSDWLLCDKAGDVVGRTNYCRQQAVRWKEPPWPKELVVVGDDGAASEYVIDLREPSTPVLFVDHGDLGSNGTYVVNQSFDDWAKEQAEIARHDDPPADLDAPAPPRNSSRGCLLAICFTAAVGVSMLSCLSGLLRITSNTAKPTVHQPSGVESK